VFTALLVSCAGIYSVLARSDRLFHGFFLLTFSDFSFLYIASQYCVVDSGVAAVDDGLKYGTFNLTLTKERRKGRDKGVSKMK